MCNGKSNREKAGYVASLDDEWSRDDGLVELEKLSFIHKEGDQFILLPLTKECVFHEFENHIDFTEKGILRLISYDVSRDLTLSREHYNQYKGRLSDSAKAEALSILNNVTIEVSRGQVPLDSTFYMERPPIEIDCYQAIVRPGSLIRIKGARQIGKSSLLSRIIQYSSQQNYKTVSLDCQGFDSIFFSDLDSFLRRLCIDITEGLYLADESAKYWDDIRSGSVRKCTRYLEKYVLPQIEEPLVLALDEVDRLFQYPGICTDFLGLIRSWHESGKRNKVWAKLRLVIVHSQEAYLPLSINQSPFNVGMPFTLPEFIESQVSELANRYGLNLPKSQVEALMKMCGGHPYLVRVALYVLARGEITFKQFLDIAPTEEGMYTDHLRRHLLTLEQYPSLLGAMKKLVSTDREVRLNSMDAFRLSSMGLLKFVGNNSFVSCDLYRLYFRERLS